ncbi:MAG TPA: type II toxin-antitoxin system VapC family toxin [Sporichthyaceae bacterium]|nr:type II toxin-antitoxin system VapC family toxin [Sporichthyaceae bacterium]
MIVLDTNVLSEMMRAKPDPAVLAWVEAAGELHTTALTLAEVDYGIARLASGRRKERLAAAASSLFTEFRDLVLPFDTAAARRYGVIVTVRERAGRPISTVDAQIAAICVSRRAALATRNTADFDDTGIRIIDPWTQDRTSTSPSPGRRRTPD